MLLWRRHFASGDVKSAKQRASLQDKRFRALRNGVGPATAKTHMFVRARRLSTQSFVIPDALWGPFRAFLQGEQQFFRLTYVVDNPIPSTIIVVFVSRRCFRASFGLSLSFTFVSSFSLVSFLLSRGNVPPWCSRSAPVAAYALGDPFRAFPHRPLHAFILAHSRAFQPSALFCLYRSILPTSLLLSFSFSFCFSFSFLFPSLRVAMRPEFRKSEVQSQNGLNKP